ncbi:MAG: DUF445 family protein [Desulfurococcales archaeon]|nr:DUF445 family protein [Desulfurococcales archaeon]
MAIKMLFHPKDKICLLPGRRLCFQGVIPGKKKELALRLGEIFSSYAMTTDALNRYWDKIEGSMATAVREILQEKLQSLPIRIPILANAIPLLSEALAENLSPYLRKLGEQASSKIDMGELIESEFNRLDVNDLEDIFHKIAGRELGFVEYMGFILGFVIGVVEGIIAILI